VTSGVVSPVIDKAIAMAYLDFSFTSEGTLVNFSVRGKEIPARVTKLPFVKK
ncbi:MAG: glycine cleavage T C-terminal barrel domain-containing protein, partial [Ignavibacteriaceae bacterium]|nr:glycine cleavage T C-terminal barrel domain-containing protein [Ignavibacteriaceae bacterium]